MPDDNQIMLVTKFKSQMVTAYDSTSVPRLDPRNFFEWETQWTEFCISKGWESLYNAGDAGTFLLPVISERGDISERLNPVRECDRKLVRGALLCCLDPLLKRSYSNHENFPSALSIMNDLKRRLEPTSKFRAHRIQLELTQLVCSDLESLNTHFDVFRTKIDDIKRNPGKFVLDSDQEIFLLTNSIRIEALRETVNRIRKMDSISAEKAILMLRERAQTLRETPGSSVSAAMTASSRFTGRCFECDQVGHRASNCPKLSANNANRGSGQGRGKGRNRGRGRGRGRGSSHRFSGSNQNTTGEQTCTNSNKRASLMVWSRKVEPVQHLALGTSKLDELPRNAWVADTGATGHFTNNKSLMASFKTGMSSVVTSSGEECKSSTSGTVQLKGTECILEMNDVTLVPEFKTNLFSLLRALDTGHYVVLFPDKCTVKRIDTNEIILTASRHSSGLFVVDLLPESSKLAACVSYSTWHSRLGHPGQEKLKMFLKNHRLECSPEENCDDCLHSKSTKLSFGTVTRNALVPLELLHMDLVGPLPCSTRGNVYFLTMVDDHSRYGWLVPLPSKAVAKQLIMELIAVQERKFELRVKRVRTDKGGEFISQELGEFFKQSGIEHETTSPYTPQQNGRAERMNRTVLTVMRTIISESGIPKDLWDYAAETATYLVNRWPKKTGQSPFEILNRRKPVVEHLHPFGCRAILNIGKQFREKLDPPGKTVILVGYSATPRNYLVYHPDSKKVTESPHVRFVESDFPFKVSGDDTDPHLSWLNVPADVETSRSVPPSIMAQEKSWVPDSPVRTVPEMSHIMYSVNSNEASGIIEEALTASPPSQEIKNSFEPQVKVSGEPIVTTRSGRVVRKPNRLTYLALSAHLNPVTREEALKRSDADQWQAAMDAELAQFDEKQVRELVPVGTVAEPVLDCRWVLRKKNNGSCKARIVARGFYQQDGINFDREKTYAPVAKSSTIRLMFALTAKLNLKMKQLDFNSAFLNADLEHPILVKPPRGTDTGFYWRLKKAVYGLRQAPRAWYETLRKEVLALGLKQSLVDPSLYYSSETYLLIYVDDLLIFSRNNNQLEKLTASLKSRFTLKEFEEVERYVGLDINLRDEYIEINQTEFIRSLAEQYNLVEAKVVSSPIAAYEEFEKCDVNHNLPIRNLIGSLMYIANRSRPDISFAVNYLSRFVQFPSERLFQAAKRILRYLLGTFELTLQYSRTDLSSSLNIYTDASYASKLESFPTTGVAVFLGDSLIDWLVKKQKSLATSTTEAELHAVADGFFLAEPVRQLIVDELKLCNSGVTFYCDNSSAVKALQNTSFMKTSHVSHRLKAVSCKIIELGFKIRFVPTEEQRADCLTKPQSGVTFKTHRSLLYSVVQGEC